MIVSFIVFLTSLISIPCFAATEVFELSLHDAETASLKTSNRLKSYVSDAAAADEQADSLFTNLLPKLSLQGGYQYQSNVPDIPIAPPLPQIPFGSTSSYNIGPTLSYTLWDTGSSRKAYHGSEKLAESRKEDRDNAELQLLLSVRSTYVSVRLGLEELRLINDSLLLARAEDHDVTTRFRAGAAARLDLVTSHRQVLSNQLQFQQRQSDLSASLKDLLALLGDDRHISSSDLLKPGPPKVENVSLVLKMDSLQELLVDQARQEIVPPDDTHPQIQSQELQAESSELSAESQKALLLPVIQTLFRTELEYPNGPVLQRINQNLITVNLSMPLFLGDSTRDLAEQKLNEAQSARYREDQTRIDIQRDFEKARELLESLRDQQQLAEQDVQQSEEAARLNYDSYKAGKINFTDVQTANNQALQSKVTAARIDGQILNQLIMLKALSGKEPSHAR